MYFPGDLLLLQLHLENEVLQPSFFFQDSVAQLVEHLPFKERVLGSSPSGITVKALRTAMGFFFYRYAVPLGLVWVFTSGGGWDFVHHPALKDRVTDMQSLRDWFPAPGSLFRPMRRTYPEGVPFP